MYFQKARSDLKALIERFWNFLPAFFCGMVIYILSTTGSIQLPESFFSSDKIGHFVAYGVLSFLILVGCFKEGRVTRPKIVWTILLCTIYGVLLEIIQYTFYPDRLFETGDAIANLIGAVGGYLTFRQLY